MWFSNKNILITGGTGTIGKALLNKLLNLDVKHVYIFSRDEQKQEAELYNLKHNPKVSFIIGDIRNYHSIDSAIRGMDIVFHIAAMKIVSICENNPYEAFVTNIIGTENVIRSASLNGVEKVVFTSSDKAANPTTVMGVGKLYSERLITHANFINSNKTIFSSVRFGNVLGSRGCVLDLFKEQIKNQDYVTVTDPAMTRFICTIDDAVDLMMETAERAVGGEIFIKKMPSIRIIDLAEVLIQHLAPILSKDPKSIKVHFIGKQPSEKLFEELVTAHEAERSLEFENYYCILPTILNGNKNIYFTKNFKAISGEVSSNVNRHLTKQEILNFLLTNKLL